MSDNGVSVVSVGQRELQVEDEALDGALDGIGVGDRTYRRIDIGGVAVDLCDEDLFLDSAEQALARRLGPAPLRVGSVNLDHIHHFGIHHFGLGDLGELDGRIGAGLGWLMLADGAPVLKAARYLTRRSYPRMAGSDLLPPLLATAERHGHRVAFLGGPDELVPRLSVALAEQYPDLQVAGHWTPPRAVVEDLASSARLALEIADTRPDMLVVGLGKPRQERWITQHGETTGASLLLAFGASADFIAGAVDRAPEWLRDNGMEWFYRLSREPRRLARRYLVQGPAALNQVVGSVVRPTVPGIPIAPVDLACVASPSAGHVVAGSPTGRDV